MELDTTSADGLTIDDTGTITVERVNFNSTTGTEMSRLSDLRTTQNGPVKVSVRGTRSLTVNEGTANPGDVAGGVVAHGMGDILQYRLNIIGVLWLDEFYVSSFFPYPFKQVFNGIGNQVEFIFEKVYMCTLGDISAFCYFTDGGS